MLWRNLKIQQVYGANTDVGKTIVSTVLCTALQKRATPGGLLYLKPVSTGPIEHADDRHLGRFVPGIKSQCISQFAKPVSPHIAARDAQEGGSGGALTEDILILASTQKAIGDHASSGGQYAIVETAGGILSPSPAGVVQADLYRPLRLPVLLVADYKLGGISCSISAFESLRLRGYDLDSVVVFDDDQWGNFSFLRDYLRKHDIETFALPKPPQRLAAAGDDELSMMEYYERTSTSVAVNEIVDLIDDKHHNRISKVTSMPLLADSILWHPFRQHGLTQEIIAIDSAYGDHFQAYRPLPHEDQVGDDFESPTQTLSSPAPILENLLTPLFDASASWWTQGFGHGNPDLSLTAAHAAGRYGHVMFANAVHAPALDLSYSLLSLLKNPRLSRVFFTDNGSTGVEVAVKMALRASCAKYGWNKQDAEVEVIGLQGSYHGDTIGVMNCSEPSTFNEKVDWHRPLGYWFDPPRLAMRNGVWKLDLPRDIASLADTPTFDFEGVAEIFDFEQRRDNGHSQLYRHFIRDTLTSLIQDGRRLGALIIEPVVMGAGGMIFVDPLFQRTLIEVVRGLCFSASPTRMSKSLGIAPSSAEWNGLPVIADEVFTGLYRLGRASSSSFFSTNHISTIDTAVAPDISVHAKLLTGGLLPLSVTTASESIFNTFLSDKKQDALLHGHSYTAHAVGCEVANKSLDEMDRLDRNGSWDGYKAAWTPKSAPPTYATETTPQESNSDTPPPDCITPLVYSFWSPTVLTSLSHSQSVSGVWALGTVLAITLRSSDGRSGYTSNAAAKLQNELLSARDESGAGVHSRVLGDVLYLMTSLTTKAETIRGIEKILVSALC